MDKTEAMNWLKYWEGVVPHMYQDTVGIITVGVGEALETQPQALDLPFTLAAFAGRACAPATADQIKADWDAVKAMAKGLKAETYGRYTKCILPDHVIDSLLRAQIDDLEKRLTARLPDFPAYPAPAQLGLLDMIYNLGETKLFDTYPTFLKAVKAKDWTTAAAECHRRGPSESRNTATKNLFLKAAAGWAHSETWFWNTIWNLSGLAPTRFYQPG